MRQYFKAKDRLAKEYRRNKLRKRRRSQQQNIENIRQHSIELERLAAVESLAFRLVARLSDRKE